jgi:hypothetical protein
LSKRKDQVITRNAAGSSDNINYQMIQGSTQVVHGVANHKRSQIGQRLDANAYAGLASSIFDLHIGERNIEVRPRVGKEALYEILDVGMGPMNL